jgi:hypothetical protein
MIAPEHVEASLVLEVEKVLQAAFEQTLRESLAASEQRLAQAAMAGRAKELEAAEARIAALQARARSSRAEIECAIIRAELALEEANPQRAAQPATGKETREGGHSRVWGQTEGTEWGCGGHRPDGPEGSPTRLVSP